MKPIGVLDFETDPFLAGRVPYPFAACIYFSDDDFSVLWDTDAIHYGKNLHAHFIDRVIRALKRLPECVLYVHNGGRFDFHYMVESFKLGRVVIRSGRIVKAKIGNVTLKDSYPLMPFPLEEFKKDEIDYSRFESNVRDLPCNRDDITSYLISDCRYLLQLVSGFKEIVGEKDTIGSAAFHQMRGLGIKIKSLNETHDEMFRPYFFGGRTQAFERGIHDERFTYVDINSAYPYAMLHEHAHGKDYQRASELPSLQSLGKCFVHFKGFSNGALPMRESDGSLEFPSTRGEFFATGWEIIAGLETKTLRIDTLYDVWIPTTGITFKHYVETFFKLRQDAKTSGDAVKALAYKYLLNSGYGKFAQNPRDFREYSIAPYGENVPGFEWESDFGAVSLWSRSAYKGFGFFDVATGASITGFVRAMLWRALCASERPIYCDTDSIICKESHVRMGANLGEWKLEGFVKRAAIAGKKLYGLEWEIPQKGEKYRIASKGARLTWENVLQVCEGKRIIWRNDAPTFSLNGPGFITREIQAT